MKKYEINIIYGENILEELIIKSITKEILDNCYDGLDYE